MKKLTFVALAVLSAATTFAQTVSTEVKNKNKATIHTAHQGQEISAIAQTSATVSASADANNYGKAERKAAKRNAESGADKLTPEQEEAKPAKENKNLDKPEKDKREKKIKTHPANHGQEVSEAAQNLESAAVVEGHAFASNHGQAVADIAHKSETSLETNTRATVENNMEAASETFQDGGKAAKEQSKEVKKVAKAKRKNKPEKIEADTEVEGAGRVATAGRPQVAAKVATASRPKGGAGRPVRVLKPGAAGKTVGVGAAGKAAGVGVGAKTKIKIGN